MCVSVWNRVLVQILIWDCELDFDLGFGFGIRILLTRDSEFGIWYLELCFGEFVACVSELLITSFQECPKQNKVWRSEALGMHYFMWRFWLTFLGVGHGLGLGLRASGSALVCAAPIGQHQKLWQFSSHL